MILKDLVNCYDLMVKSDKYEIADLNSSMANVSFKFIIGEDGLIKQVFDFREKKKGIQMLVPLQNSRAAAIYPYFLCDKAKYFLGYGLDEKKGEYVFFEKYFLSSKKLHEDILGNLDTKYSNAVLNFFNKLQENFEFVKEKEVDVFKDGFIVLSFEDEKRCIHEDSILMEKFESYLAKTNSSSSDKVISTCLITGEADIEISRLHEKTKGVAGANASGANIISFNAQAFESYGKSQSYNSPVSKRAMFKYTTALNTLIKSKNNNLYLSGNTVVFWSDKIGSIEEGTFEAFFNEEDIKKSDKEIIYNETGSDGIKTVIECMRKGMTVDVDNIEMDDINLYILGLSPSNARIFIRFWFKNSIKDFIKLANRHFEDTKLKRRRKYNKKDFIYEEVGVKISTILKTITPFGKAQNTPKTLINSLFKSVLNGTVYPLSVYNAVLGRIRAESGEDFAVNHTRVAFLKGYLKRYYRLNNFKEKEEEVTVALNLNSTNTAYNLGRVFAFLEKIQGDANGSSNIRERYLSSASSTPKSVFPNLINLAQHHISKINKSNNKTLNYYDKVIGQILLNVDDFPSTFSSDEQGMFILGYYHQREDIYTKKQDKENVEVN